MHYFFLDEPYPPAGPGQKSIVMAAWAVEQHRWGHETASRFDVYKGPILKRVCSMIESLDGAAVAAKATLTSSLFRSGEIDRTNDIPEMKRPDLVWSMSAVFVLGTLILELFVRKQEVGTVDIHFDSKTLKSAHSEAWKKTIRQLVVREGKRFASERGFIHLKKLNIRRVEPVAKADHRGRVRDKFSMGIWAADKLCGYFDEIKTVKECSRILSLDMSESVRRTTQQFDGKSFDEP
jgi:hypothetical protein